MAIWNRKKDEEEEKQQKPEQPKQEEKTPEPAPAPTPVPPVEDAAKAVEIPAASAAPRRGIPKLNADQRHTIGQNHALRNVDFEIEKHSELENLPAALEPRRDEYLQKEREGKLTGSAARNWGSRQISVDVRSIRDEQELAYFVSTLDNDSDKVAVMKAWAKENDLSSSDVIFHGEELLGNRLFKEPQTAQGALNAMGLVDANGDKLDLRSADFASVVHAAQGIPDKETRKQAFEYIEKMTKTYGSRFVGMNLDGVSKDFRNSLDFPQKEYDDFVGGLESQFYAADGHEEENLRRYMAQYDAINGATSTLSAAQKHWYTKALDAAFVQQMGYGSTAPDAQKAREVLDQLDAARSAQETPNAPDVESVVEDKPGLIAGAWQTLVGFVSDLLPKGKKDAEGPEAAPAPQPEATPAPTETMRTMGRAEDLPVTLVASASPAPPVTSGRAAFYKGEEAEQQTPEVQGPAYQPKAMDPATALEYAHSGRADQLDAATQEMLGGLYASASPGTQALLNVVTPEFYREYQTGNVPADFQWMETMGSQLGSSIMKYVRRISREDFPHELYGDAVMAIKEIIEAADADATITQNELAAMGRYESYIQKNKDALAPIEKVFEELEGMRQDAEADNAAIQADKDAELARDRQAVALGQGSAIQYQNVLNHAPEMDNMMAMRDPTYAAMFDNLATEFFSAAGNWDRENPAWMDTYVFKTMKANGVQDLEGEESAYEMLIHGTMESLLLQDMRVASALDMSLEAYYAKQGGMDLDMLADRASAQIVAAGSKTSEQELSEFTETVSREAEGLGAGQTLVLTGKTGMETVRQGRLESFIMVAAATDIQRDTARVATDFNHRYGAMWGRTAYRKQMYAYANSGKLPEALSKEIIGYLDEGGDPYQLGIHPGDNAWAVDEYDKATRNIETYQKIIASQATEGEKKFFETGTSVVSNARMMGEVAGLSLALTPILGPVGSFVAIRTVYGSVNQGRSMGEFMKDGYSLRESLMLSEMEASGEALANVTTLGHLTEHLKGYGALLNKGLMTLGGVKNPAVVNGFVRGVGTFFKTAAGEIAEETIKDPLLEGTFSSALVGAGKSVIEDARDGDLNPTTALKHIVAGVDAAVGSVPETVSTMIDEAPQTMLATLPFALLGAGGEVVRNSASAKAARTYIENPSEENAKAFTGAVMKDAQDGRWIENVMSEMREAEVAEETAANLVFAPDPALFEKAQKTGEQADSHKKQMEASQTRIDEGWAAYDEGEANGNVDEQLAALEIVAKGKQGLEEHTREYEQKSLEAKEAERELVQEARGRAEATVSDRRARQKVQDTEAEQDRQMADTEQRESGNVDTMDADAFIEANYPEATDEEKQALRERYMARAQAKRDAQADGQTRMTVGDGIDALRNTVQIAKRLEQRYGTNIRFVKSLDGAEALYDGKTIYVGMDATQGDVIKRVLVHELTHSTEDTALYKSMRDALLNLKYGGDAQKLQADIQAKIRRYDAHYKKVGRTDKFTADDALKEIVADYNGELLSGNEEMIRQFVEGEPTLARKIYNGIKRFVQKLRGVNDPEFEQIRKVEKLFETALKGAQTQRREFGTDGVQYSLREKEPPKNVVYAYKAFYARDGKLYPPMVANITDEADKQKVKKATSGTMRSLPTPVGVWLDADVGGIMTDDAGEPVRAKDTKRLRVKNDKSGGGATLAFRPGWHLGEWPDAKQFNKADPETGERGKRMPDDLVFAKCEVSADVDYQLDALSYGLSDKGGFSRSQAGLPYVPDDGYYKYRTNVDPSTAPWLIAGSIRVVEILDDEDCARICAEYGVMPDQRYSGKPIDLSKYGLKRGPVEETTEGMERFKENDANRANKKLLERSLNDPKYADAYVQREIDFENPKQYEQLQKEFAMNGQDIEAYRKKYTTEGFASDRRAKVTAESPDSGDSLVGKLAGNTAVRYSLKSWTVDEKIAARAALTKAGHKAADVERWIDQTNSVAAVIAADKDRLDFEAADNQVMLKDNAEYVKTLDASTLCAKRLLYQGTFDAIQHALPDHVFTSEELLDLLNLMKEEGYETPCGVCYVESRRRHLGKYASEWLEGYDAKGGYQPKLDDVTTTDGLERMRHEHPEVYKSFVDAMNSKGSNNPKVVQLRTDYRGDIRRLTKSQVEKVTKIGGLRVQSFSDFETPHLLDMMQATLDMAGKGLTSQAYTKVPNFAWVFGDTGIKINLSLMAEGSGVDENGNLVFSSTEGMPIDEAMALRARYSENVGTIIVGANDDHIRAAMADPRIDYIIPFHRSGWGKNELQKVGVLQAYTDYQANQNERRITGQTKDGKPKYSPVKEGNFYPIDYWDYSKSGDENAATYLRMCEADDRVPKFEQFLTKDADGHWVAPSGYWKMLIDFKMYDNDGVGAPQRAVTPEINMDEAMRVLDEYEGGANELPVAQDIVDRFVDEIGGKSEGRVQYSLKGDDAETMHIKDQIRQNQERLNEMGPVASIRVLDDMPLRDKKQQKRWILDNLRDTGYKVDRQNFGVIEFAEKQIDTSLNYLNTPEEIAAFLAIPRVLKRGVEIYQHKDHKERGFPTVTIAAPVTINGSLGNMGIVIKKMDKNRYKTHRILMPDGSAFIYEKEKAELTPAGGAAVNGPHDQRIGSANPIIAELDTFDKGKYSLPSDDALDAEIDAWRSAHEAQMAQAENLDGESQFAQTAQKSPDAPEWWKREVRENALLKNYATDVNADQLKRATRRIAAAGYEAEVQRLLDADSFDADDTAEAGAIMNIAFGRGDVQTALDMALKYRVDGKGHATALQSRKMFAGMTPTNIKIKVAGEMEEMLSDYVESHQPRKRRVHREAEKIDEVIRGLTGGDELERMAESGEIDVSQIDNRWGVPLNEKQKHLIDHYKLGNVARPGVHYNRATTKQRMLEAILCTPDPDKPSGNGLTLTQRLEWMKEGNVAVITQADLAYIADQIAEYCTMPEEQQSERAADLALARAYEAYGNIAPAGKREKMRTWRYTSMLLSLPSAMRNVIGNSAQGLLNATADGLAVELDRLVSAFTKERTRAHLTLGERLNGWNEFAQETRNTGRDVFADKAITAHGEDRYNLNQRGRVFQNQAAETLRLIEGYLMSVGDRNFYRKKYINSLAEQYRVAEMNGVELDYEAAADQAEAEAKYATFNEDSAVRSLFTQAKKIPIFGDAIDFLMPFTGVPTNIVKRMYQYSPAGLAITAIKHGVEAAQGKNFDQRAFVDGMSRGLTGTALFAVGMALMEAGKIHLGTGEEEDEKLRDLHTTQGAQYSPYIQVGNENVSLAALAPSISPIIMGATAYDIFKDDDVSLSALTNACLAGADQIFDASYMSALQDVFKGYGSPTQNIAKSALNSAVSQNVPSVLSQIATAMDPYVRDTKDTDYIMSALKSGLIQKIPGLRTAMLEPKYDITGTPVTSKEGIRNFIDPFTTTKIVDDPVLDELERLVGTTGSSSHIPEFLIANSGRVQILAAIADEIGMDRSVGENIFNVSAEERNRYNQLYSKMCFDEIRELMMSDAYRYAGDGDKAAMISKIRKNTKLAVQKQICKDRGWNVE